MFGCGLHKKIRVKLFTFIILGCTAIVGFYAVRIREVHAHTFSNNQTVAHNSSEYDFGNTHLTNALPSLCFGHILSTQNAAEGGIIEKVKLFVKEDEESLGVIERNGILVRYPQAVGTVLVCHGFMCDKFDVGFLRQIFPKKRFNVMTFDFRAHGEAVDGQYCTFGYHEALDVQTAAQFLRHHPALRNKPLFAYGFSMGAAASIEAQAKDSSLFDAMILDCPFDSSENVIKRGLDCLKLSVFGYQFDLPGKTWLQDHVYNPYVQSMVKSVLKTVAQLDTKNVETNFKPINPSESIKNVMVPCFFIHCKNDEKVPVDAIKSVYENASGQKKLWITNGRRHYDSLFYNPEVYAHKVVRFLNAVVSGTIQKKPHNKVIEDPNDEPTALLQAIAAKKEPVREA